MQITAGSKLTSPNQFHNLFEQLIKTLDHFKKTTNQFKKTTNQFINIKIIA